MRLGVNFCSIASSVWLNGFNMSPVPLLIPVSVLQDTRVDFANNKMDKSGPGGEEIGNRREGCSELLLCFDMTN